MYELEGLLRPVLSLLREWRAPVLAGKAPIAELIDLINLG
jgi:hypothetical protein